MNAQPEKNERSKAGTVHQTAGNGSGGSGILVSGNGRPLPDIDRNPQSAFLDSLIKMKLESLSKLSAVPPGGSRQDSFSKHFMKTTII